MNLDQRLFKMTWDTTVEYHKPHEMREKFAKTNLFGGDGVWTSPHPFLSTPCSNLEEVLSMIRPEEKWTCDNCTIEIVEEPGVYSEGLGYATHDEQEMSQGYHGPSFKGGE